MVSDKIRFSNGGAGIVEALAQAEKTAAFRELEKREALHLRLFAEEMLGMARSLTGEREGDFWIESEGRRFCLHLKVITPMNAEKRKNLLAASTSGKNAAAVGFMGKIRDLFERSFEAPGGAYLSPVESAGLRSLLSAHKKMRGAMTVCNVNEVNREIFEITGFTDILHFE